MVVKGGFGDAEVVKRGNGREREARNKELAWGIKAMRSKFEWSFQFQIPDDE